MGTIIKTFDILHVVKQFSYKRERSMYGNDIWDFINHEWLSLNEFEEFHGDMDESDYQYNFLGYEKYLQHKENTTNISNKPKRNTSNTNNSQNKSRINATNMRKPHMALQYKKAKLMEHIKSNLEQITPSNIDEKNISSLFLPKIWDTINESIKKDINELFRAYGLGLWTATSLMAYRIFENILKVHINHNLKEEPAIDITDAIKKLENHKYDTNLIKTLYELKEYRNSFMHGNTRASTQEAKESIVKVMSLAMNIHNIEP